MGSGRRAIFAGFWGGLAAGALDGGVTLLDSFRVLGWPASLHLLAIDVGLGAMAGSALAIVFVGWSLGLERLLGQSRWWSGAHAVALLLASPLLIYDAFALFHGAQASRIPAHHLISVLLILVGAGGLWAGTTLWRGLLSWAEPRADGNATSGGRRVPLLAAGLLLALAALVVGWANEHVLPRLYHWFHLSLTLSGLVLCGLAVRLLLGGGRSRLGRRWSWILAAVAVIALAVGVTVEQPIFAQSQRLRFYVYEKTQLASLFAGLLGARTPSTTPLAAASTTEDLSPLPPGPHRREADVVLITVDAVRADHVGCYGYARPTTPNLDALAASSVRFARAYTQAPHTSFAIASLMIGKYYPTLARLASSDSHETLAAILRRYGWKTAAFFPPAVFYVDAHKMKAFESNNFDFEYVKYEYLSAEERVGQIEDFLAAEPPKKLFLWLHLFEPHEPYERHAGFDFGTRDIDRYDSEIAYSDMVVGKVLALLREKRPGAIVIVAADHGEEFGEHGGRYHGTTLFDEQEHIPLIVAVPGLRPHVVAGPVEIIDIPATILGLLDIPPPLRMRGTDLGPWLQSGTIPESRLPPAFAEVEDKRMVALGTEKLICSISKDYCSYFDLATDPGEQHDLADQRPERVTALRQRIDAWLARQARYEARLVGAAGDAGELARAIERGRLGDARAAEPLARMLVGEAPVPARREAASLLASGLAPQPETKDALLAAAARADDEQIRAWAAVAALRLGATDLQERVRALVAKPAGVSTALLHTYAALALAENSDRAGVATLVAALDSCGSDILLCRRVLAALGQLRDAAAVEPLVAHLPFLLTRGNTVAALANIGDARAVGPLIGCLENDEYVSVRMAAATALGRLGGARAVQGLEAALGHEREEAVREAVRAALAKLGRGK
jgi:arylsulfatase A-like enzyme/HEAT repeat protein